MIVKYVWRELKAYPRYTVLFILNLVLGLTGFAVLETFKTSIQYELNQTSKGLTGGDLVVSSRLPIPDSELNKIKNLLVEQNRDYEIGEIEEVFTMAQAGNASRLVQIIAQDLTLPFYGSIGLKTRGDYLPEGNHDLLNKKHIWVYPELLQQLDLKVNDEINVGGIEFIITDVVTRDTAATSGRGALAPRVYMSRSALQKTQLIQKGSTVSYKKVFKLSPPDEINKIEELAKSLIKDPAINVRSHINANEANAQMIGYLNDYLGLVSLIALLLSCIGAIYLFRAHLVDRMRDIAVLKMLGLESQHTFRLGLVQTLILGFAGSLGAVAISFFLFPTFTTLTDKLIPITISLKPNPWSIILIFAIGVFATALCVWPLMRKVKSVTAKALFQDSGGFQLSVQPKDIMAWVPFLLFFYLLAVRQANSYLTSTLFVVLIIVSAGLLFAIGFFGIYLLERVLAKFSFEIKYGLRELARRQAETMTAFIALSLGALMIFLIFSIEKTVKSEFEFGSANDRPSLFMFDIQEEQLEELKTVLKQNDQVLQTVSPLIRARLEKVNNSPYERSKAASATREAEQAESSRNRGFNLTERGVLSKSEDVVKGRYFLSAYNPQIQKEAEISVEVEWARRMGLSVGDVLEFDVLGVPVLGRIIGERKVRWASFQPNFFVQFQEGVFVDTPKSFVASLPAMIDSDRLKIQTQIVKKFPNISILDVTITVDRILELATRMAWVLKFMAFLVFLTGIGVVWSIQGFHVHRSRGERRLLGLLGLRSRQIQRIEKVESGLLISAGVFCGFAISLIVIWPVSTYVFGRMPRIEWITIFVWVMAWSIGLILFIYRTPRRNIHNLDVSV